MALLGQAIELLSRPPGSVIYHLLTLFALQIVLALAYSRWQRDAGDESSRRMTAAAAGILVARLILLFVGLMMDGDPTRARIVLPPMEQAIDLATVILLVWGLAPFAMGRPRLADGALLVSLIVVAVMFLIFFQDWQNRVATTGITTPYIGTIQTYVWGLLQITILGIGLARLLMKPASRLTMRPIIVAVVLLAHIVNFFNYPEVLPSGTEVTYWLRLGYLVAFPLWAVLAYRENLHDLMTAAEADRAQADQLAHNLRLTTDVIATRTPEARLEQVLNMVTGLIPTQFATIGLIDERNPQRVVFGQLRTKTGRDIDYSRQIKLSDYAAFRLAFEQQRGIELLSRGVGARQAHDLSQQFNVGALGPVFIEPLVTGGQCFGFLMLAAPTTAQNWSEHDRTIIPGLAAFASQALANGRRIEGEKPAQQVTGQLPAALPASAHVAERDTDKERLIIELAETRRMLTTAEERARQAASIAASPNHIEPSARPAIAWSPLAYAAIGPALEYAVESVLSIIRRRDLKLDIAVSGDLPPVAVKEAALRQLVLSLLENACRASAEDSAVLVHVDLPAVNGSHAERVISLMVTDTGAGIRPEDRERVFDSKYYLSGGRPILGLGDSGANLPVVQKLAQASGGDLNFDSHTGEGTTFTLRLPIAEDRPWTSPKSTIETEEVPEASLEAVSVEGSD